MADEGRESVFLSSMSKSESEQSNGKDSRILKPFRSAHGFYKYEINSEDEEKKITTKPSSLERTSNKHFSLTSLTTSLNADDEALLLKFLNRKLSKNSVEAGIGHISSIDLTLGEPEPSLFLCYYCLLRQKGSSPVASTVVTADDLASLGLDDLDLPAIGNDGGETESPDTFIVCLIAPIESQLDLFKADLDKFSSNLLAKLDFETSDVVTVVKPLLETWFTKTTNFLRNCVQRLESDVKYLIHAALTDSNIEVDCSDKEFTNDLRRFFECCSLSDLLSNNQSDSPSSRGTPDSGADLLVDFTGNKSPSTTSSQYKVKVTVNIKVDGEKITFENHECSKFCEDWSQALENCDVENVSVLRQVIESYKLKAIQDMNTLKRLLKQAESDHYSLYRCYMFLKQCGHGAILLQHADQEMSHSENLETTQVLDVLHEYIRQAGGLLVR